MLEVDIRTQRGRDPERTLQNQAADTEMAIEHVEIEATMQFDRIAGEHDLGNAARKIATEARPAECRGKLRHVEPDDREGSGVAVTARRTRLQADFFETHLTTEHVDCDRLCQHDLAVPRFERSMRGAERNAE